VLTPTEWLSAEQVDINLIVEAVNAYDKLSKQENTSAML
jgi:hypothetical protein